MKTNRFQNGSVENAKERVGSLHGLPVTRPGKSRKNTAMQCGTPGRATTRRRLAVTEEAVTTIAAQVDIGFGNTLFIRGEGGGLSWDEGQPLVCVDGSRWIWSGKPGTEAVTFKLLINDQLWCRGENLQVAAGSQIEVVPSF